jgi:uncharacterized membrane protein YuzA (DUF378 family)
MKKFILATILTLTLSLTGLMIAQPAYAACPTASDNTSKDEVLKGLDNTGNDCSSGGVGSTVSAAVNILSLVVGIAAIIMVIVSGFKYITSNGDSGKVTAAKNTLIYALIGLAIAALAQTLVNIVFDQATTASTTATCKPGQHPSTKDVTQCIPN